MGVLVIANIAGAWPTSMRPTVDVRVVDTLNTDGEAEIDAVRERVATEALAMIRDSIEASDTIRIHAGVRHFDIVGASWDYRLLLISLWFGALGSLLHAGSSFASFVGNRQLLGSWLPWYIVRPFLGAGLAAVFYVVVRAGLATTGGMPLADVSHFTVAAAAALVGLFTHRATVKLGEVFDAIFPPREGNQHADTLGGEQSATAPRITALSPERVRVGEDAIPVEIVTDHASDDVTLAVSGEETEFRRLPSGNLRFVLEAGLRERQGTVEVVLRSEVGTSEPALLRITP